MTRNTWIIFTTIVVVLFGGLIYFSSKDKVDVSKIDTSKIQTASKLSGNIADHTFGSKADKVVLIEYGDYQCPGCGAAHTPIKEVTEKYKDQLTFVFRNFPLTSLHPNAKAAAAAAEVAGLKGKFWEMHNHLYENQDDWASASANDRTDLFASYAEEIGLNKSQFKSSLENDIKPINQKLNFDTALGKKNGVDGTPTFFLNGKKIDEMYKDNKLVPKGTADAQNVWGNADAFDKLILQPAFKKAGIDIPKIDQTKK